MHIEFLKACLFFLSATVLLGTPGPGIAALVAIGKSRGFAGGLRFFWGLQGGIATASAICGLGLFSIARFSSAAMNGLSIVGTTYLVWLAYRIATAPIGSPSEARPVGFAATAGGGYLLGVTNPKAYIAFVSLMASYAIVRASPLADVSFKWMACVIIVFVVDVVWLWVGAIVGRANLGRRAERSLNVLMGSTVLVAAALSWI